MLVSIIVTVKNEGPSMPALLDSLLVQEPPFEIIVIDSESTDETLDIVKEYATKHTEIHLYVHDATRGESRNFGVKKSKGEVVAFTDGSCIADKEWLREFRKTLRSGKYDTVAGNTIHVGSRFSDVPRVGIYINGGDASFPTCNLCYRKEFFDKIGGFDPWFKEGEDVDLNYRALKHDARQAYNEKAIIRHSSSETAANFIKKSFWYGFARKELSIRHGNMSGDYNVLEMVKLKKGESPWKYIRLAVGYFGFLYCTLIGGKTESKERLRNSRLSRH